MSHLTSDPVSESEPAILFPATWHDNVAPNVSFRLVRDALTNYSATVVAGLTGLLMVPILLHQLGAEQYGLWVGVLLMAGMVPLDFGLGWSLTREISSDIGSSRPETMRFVQQAGNLFFRLGLLGALIIALVGLPLSTRLRMSESSRPLAAWIFCIVGISFLGDHLTSYVVAVLHGLRRFGLANTLYVSVALVKAIGSLALLFLGGRLLAVALWQAIVSLCVALISLQLIGSIEPRYRFRLSFDSSRSLFSSMKLHLRFGVGSQFAMWSINSVWQITPLLVTFIFGPAAIIAYTVGQKFPLALSMFNWKAAEPMFPAVGETGSDLAQDRAVLKAGTRWILVVATPICIILWFAAPSILQAWLGSVPQGSVLILRVTTLAALADAVGVGALHVLWAKGEIRTILNITTGMLIATVATSTAILWRFDSTFAVLGLIAPLIVGAILFMHAACRRCGMTVANLASGYPKLCLPALFCAAAALAMQYYFQSPTRLVVFASSIFSLLTYVVSFYLFAATQNEKLFARSLFTRQNHSL
ncbi:MAG: polysaccharide biosynthesis protein [Acidobacteriales bacterium]|nr:polysaccharide biosynthesis protein [Terriglobales bacterium]